MYALSPDSSQPFIDWVNSLPLARTFGVRCVEAAVGRSVMKVEKAPFAPNPNGAVNGGIMSALIDHVMGATAMTVMQRRAAPVTASLNVLYLEPALVPLTFKTRVIRASRALVFMECEVFSGNTLVETSTGTFVPLQNYLLDPKDAPEGTEPWAMIPPRLDDSPMDRSPAATIS